MSKTQTELNEDLFEAIWREQTDVVEALIAEGAEINPQNSVGTPLGKAISTGQIDLAKKLILDYKAEVNPQNTEYPPLLNAVSIGREDMVNLLFENAQFSQEIIIESLIKCTTVSPAQDILISKITDLNAPSEEKNGSEKGNTLLGRAVCQGNKGLISKLLQFGAKITDHHYQLAQKHWSLEYTHMLLEEELKSTNDRQSLLSKAIKFKAELADQLLAEGAKIDDHTLMSNLATAISSHNPQIIDVLLKHKIKFDWNAPADSDGNSLIMLLVKNRESSDVIKYVALKDHDGLPIFKINHENNHGKKLIDVVNGNMEYAGPAHTMQIINALREVGSAEPTTHVAMPKVRLDTENVHLFANEWGIKEMQKKLHAKYSSESIDIGIITHEIVSYITNSSDLAHANEVAKVPERVDRVIKQWEEYKVGDPMMEFIILAAADPGFLVGIRNTLDLYISDRVEYIDHNNSWSFPQELAYLYLECRDSTLKMNQFIVNIGKGLGSPWATLVHLYKTIEEPNPQTFEPITNFDDFVQDQNKTKALSDGVVKSLQNSGMSDQMIKKVINEFYEDLKERKAAKDYSLSTELVKGYFFKAFMDLMIKDGKDVLTIYSQDAISIYNIVEGIISLFEFESEEDYTLFYKLIHSSKTENSKATDSTSPQFQTTALAVDTAFQDIPDLVSITELQDEVQTNRFAGEDAIIHALFQSNEPAQLLCDFALGARLAITTNMRYHCLIEGKFPPQAMLNKAVPYYTLTFPDKISFNDAYEMYLNDHTANLYRTIKELKGNVTESLLPDEVQTILARIEDFVGGTIYSLKSERLIKRDENTSGLNKKYIAGHFLYEIIDAYEKNSLSVPNDLTELFDEVPQIQSMLCQDIDLMGAA